MNLIPVPRRFGIHVGKKGIALRCEKTIEVGVLSLWVVQKISHDQPGPPVIRTDGRSQWSSFAKMVMALFVLAVIPEEDDVVRPRDPSQACT